MFAKWFKARKLKKISQCARARKRDQIWFAKHKSNCICRQCNETHPSCLEFHHRNPKTKTFAISKGVSKGWSIKKLQGEMLKCDVLCSNCHRKLHYRGI